MSDSNPTIWLIAVFLLGSTIKARAEAKDTIYADKLITARNELTLSQLIENVPLNGVLVLGNRTYQTTQVRIPHRMEIIGSDGTIIQPVEGASYNALIIATAPLVLSGVVVDGKKMAFWGIYSTSDLSVRNCTITDFFGTQKGPGNGIRHLSEDPLAMLCIENSVVKNISGYEDGVVGNYVGAHRGVLTNGGRVLIQGTRFESILGEEDADCIHIQTASNDKDGWKSAGNVLIDGCKFINFGKRAIKIQASDVTVNNNEIKNEDNKIYSAISIYGSRNVVDNNLIDVANATAALTIISGNQNKVRNNTVVVDRERGGRMSWGVAFDKPSNTTLSGNTFITNGRRSPFSYSKNITNRMRRNMERSNPVQIRKQH